MLLEEILKQEQERFIKENLLSDEMIELLKENIMPVSYTHLTLPTKLEV